MSRRIVTIDDFSAGEFGALNEFTAPKGSFTGLNVVRYIDGSLGPRWEPEAMTITGLANGAILGMGIASGATNTTQCWFVQGTAVRQFNALATASQAVVNLAGALAITAVDLIGSTVVGDILTAITVFSDGMYTLDHSAATVTARAGEPAAYAIAQYGERTMAANVAGNPNRLYYSAAADHTSWPAANYIDVGDSSHIRALIAQRGGLSISKIGTASTGETPLRAQWWRLSGVPGVNETLQQALVAPAAAAEDQAAVLNNGNVGFAAAYAKYPAVFSGASVQSLKHLAFTNAGAYAINNLPSHYRVLPLRDDADWMILADPAADSGRSAFMLREHCWTKHTFGTALTGSWAVSIPLANLVIMAKNGTGGAAPVFYQWTPYVNRPNLNSDSFGGPPAAAVVEFTLPAVWLPEVGEDRLAAIAVDFKKWDQGTATNNSFTTTVTPLRRDGGEATAASVAWSEAPGSSSASGTQASVTNAFSLYGGGFRVRIHNMYGVAIQRIHLILDNRPSESTSDE